MDLFEIFDLFPENLASFQVVSTRAQSGPHSMNLLIEDDDSKEAIEKQRVKFCYFRKTKLNFQLSEKDGAERVGLAELDKNGMLFLTEDIGESLKVGDFVYSDFIYAHFQAAGKDISKLSLPFISTQSNVNQKAKGDMDSDSGDEIDGSKTPLLQTGREAIMGLQIPLFRMDFAYPFFSETRYMKSHIK